MQSNSLIEPGQLYKLRCGCFFLVTKNENTDPNTNIKFYEGINISTLECPPLGAIYIRKETKYYLTHEAKLIV